MDNYIAILLLVMPGFVSRKIYKHTSNIREDLSTFEETMYCLLNSVFIILILLLCIFFIYKIESYRVLSEKFNSLLFIVGYGFSALSIACVLGIFTEWIRGKYNWVINFIRRKRGMALLSISHDVLDDILLADGMQVTTQNGKIIPRFIEIYKDGIMIARGGLKFGNCKYREFELEDAEAGIEEIMKEFKKMPPVKKIYVDGRQGITIKEYDVNSMFFAED